MFKQINAKEERDFLEAAKKAMVKKSSIPIIVITKVEEEKKDEPKEIKSSSIRVCCQ